MLSLRVTRDRRGYDHIYLIDETRKRGRTEGRLLYWCRMPGGMRVGRDPFDEDTRRRLERANPGVVFDWPALTRSLSASISAARWAARQQQELRAAGRSQGPQRSDRGRPSQKQPPPRRNWREDDEAAPDDGEVPSPEPAVETARGLAPSEPEPDPGA